MRDELVVEGEAAAGRDRVEDGLRARLGHPRVAALERIAADPELVLRRADLAGVPSPAACEEERAGQRRSERAGND